MTSAAPRTTRSAAAAATAANADYFASASYTDAAVEGLQRTAENSLQLVALHCEARIKSRVRNKVGRQCKCNGKYAHEGKNYCKRHYTGVTGFAPARDAPAGAQASHAEPMDKCIIVDEDEQCNICWGQLLDQPLCITNCGHVFHEQCLRTWKAAPRGGSGAENTCPTCRRRTNAFRQTSQYNLVKRVRLDICSC